MAYYTSLGTPAGECGERKHDTFADALAAYKEDRERAARNRWCAVIRGPDVDLIGHQEDGYPITSDGLTDEEREQVEAV
jgi:hypothetical protein